MSINLELQGALAQLQWTSSTASAPVSHHGTLRRKPPSVALGALPSTGEKKIPMGLGADSAIPTQMAILTQMPPWASTPGDISSFTHVTHPLLQPTVLKSPEVASMCMFPPGLSQLDCQISYLCYRRE